MKQLIDFATWPRREHFAFFSQFDEPFWGLTTALDCTRAHAEAKRLGVSFYLYYLHAAATAANRVPEFRYRIEDGRVVCYDQVHLSPTIGRADHTFGFGFIGFRAALADFVPLAQHEIARVQALGGLGLSDATARPDVLHCSALPWVQFTGLSHARSFRSADSCPKISFGKLFVEGHDLRLPVSVHVHHGLADGYHVGEFLRILQELLS